MWILFDNSDSLAFLSLHSTRCLLLQLTLKGSLEITILLYFLWQILFHSQSIGPFLGRLSLWVILELYNIIILFFVNSREVVMPHMLLFFNWGYLLLEFYHQIMLHNQLYLLIRLQTFWVLPSSKNQIAFMVNFGKTFILWLPNILIKVVIMVNWIFFAQYFHIIFHDKIIVRIQIYSLVRLRLVPSSPRHLPSRIRGRWSLR